MAKKINEIKTNPKPMFYACVLEGLRKIAFKCGYTLAIHGTCASDMDLIAVQWNENYESAQYLRDRFLEELSNYCFGDVDPVTITDPTTRYGNQIHYSIPIIGDWFVDLTVINSESKRLKQIEKRIELAEDRIACNQNVEINEAILKTLKSLIV